MSNEPLTNAQKQRRRVSELDAIAQAAGWWSIGTALTAIRRGIVKLPRKPSDYNDIPAASRANGRRGGRPRKEKEQS